MSQHPLKGVVKSNLTSASLCIHTFAYLGTNYFMGRHQGSNCFYWNRVDRFYCSKCIEIKELKKEEMTYGSRPDWYIEK